MPMTLRFSPSSFLGVAPLFRRREEPRAPGEPTRVEPARGEPPPAAQSAPRIDVDRILAATREKTVELCSIEWDGDDAMPCVAEPPVPAAANGDDDPRNYDARCRRIRDRYIGARFPGVARGAADLQPSDRVVKAARLYFEDGHPEAALELLDLAIEQDSRAEALWLAQLEILFLVRDGARFIETARAFRAMHPASGAWPEVARLGRALMPREGFFGPESGPREHEHYGPWPDLPNWIQANWDLTAEVLAADFHRVLAQRAEAARTADKSRLAA